MSFLPSFASPFGSTVTTESRPKFLITVSPLRPSVFAGELFQAKISFSCSSSNPSSTSDPFATAPLTSLSSSPHTPKKLVHRTVQSLSVPAARSFRDSSARNEDPYHLLTPNPPHDTFPFNKHRDQDLPPRRGLIGKKRKSTDGSQKDGLTEGARPNGHLRRSSSGSDLADLIGGLMVAQAGSTGGGGGGSGGDEILVGESPKTVDLKGKGRAGRPAFGRSQSISTMPGVSEESFAHSPPRKTPPLPTYSSMTTRNLTAFPPSHPHARKPSVNPSTLSQSAFPSIEPGPSSRSVSNASSSSNLSMPSILETEQSESPALDPLESPYTHQPEPEGRGLALDLSVLGSDSPIEPDYPPPPTMDAPSTPARPSPLRPSIVTRPSGAGHRSRPSYSSGLGLGVPSLQPAPSPELNRSVSTSSTTSSTEGLTITWSYVHLQANLIPSPQYLSAESLLPLRHSLLETSSIGSGMLPTPSSPTPGESAFPSSIGLSPASLSPATWFSLPPPPLHSKSPSLTSSLFGIARGVWNGVGVQATGSMEAERRMQWEKTVKEVPVLETLKTVLGVGLPMKPVVEKTESGSDSIEYIYSIQIPSNLPPSFKGRALKISYSLIVGIEIEYALPPVRPGFDNPSANRKRRTQSQVIKVPVRVWGGVDGPERKDGYDLMRPVIQRREEASLQKLDALLPEQGKRRRSSRSSRQKKEEAEFNPAPSTESSFRSYAAHLLSTLPPPQDHELPPLSPDAPLPPTDAPPPSTPLKHHHTRSQALSPGTHSILLPEIRVANETATDSLTGSGKRRRRVPIDSAKLEEDETECEDMLEELLRRSRKASYDIEKDGQVVAVFTLVKSAYRLGETVQGVVQFNEPTSIRRVLKFSAQLQAHEIIPSPLLPPHGPLLKALIRTHADFHSSLTIHTSRLPFSLDVPSPGTAGGSGVSPSFVLRAGPESAGGPGGLEWKIKLSFLVSVPIKSGLPGSRGVPAHLVPTTSAPGQDPRHHCFQAAESIAPVVAGPSAGSGERQGGVVEWAELRTEVVECDVPITVYPPSRLGVGAASRGDGQTELRFEL